MNEVAAHILSKWRLVGIQLNIKTEDLNSIRVDNPHYSRLELFIEVFSLWKDNCTREYSWATMIEVLKAPSVDEKSLAEQLNRKLKEC